MEQLMTWTKSIFQSNGKVKENLWAFACGDVMLFTFIGIPPEVSQLGWKVFSTVLLAIAGGIAGMVGKDLYVWVKAKIKSYFK